MDTVGNGRKPDQTKTCPTRYVSKIRISAQRCTKIVHLDLDAQYSVKNPKVVGAREI